MKKLSVIAAICLSSQALAQTGQVAITVHDPSGKPLPSARVAISSRPTYQPGASATFKPTTYNASALSNSAGIASFTGVPVGAYAICAALPSSQLVDTCTFTEHPTSVYVMASKPAAATVTLFQGAQLTVLLNDAQQLLVPPAALTASSRQIWFQANAVRGPGRPLAMSSLAAASRQYTLLVPVGTPLELVIGSSGYKVADSTGKLLVNPGSRSVVRFQVPTTSTAQSIQLNVVGTF